MFKDKKKLSIFLIALIPLMALVMLPFIGSAKAAYEVVNSDEYVYFDLAAGSVFFDGTQYKGFIYVDGVKTTVFGTHTPGTKYYIYQSTSSNRNETGLVNGEMHIPVYNPIFVTDTNTGLSIPWNEYITNNTSPEDVELKWPIKGNNGKFQDRTPTDNRIFIIGAAGDSVDFVFDNLWGSYTTSCEGSPEQYPVGIYTVSNSSVDVKLKGENRFAYIWSATSEVLTVNTSGTESDITSCRSGNSGRLLINSFTGNDADGSLTLTCKESHVKNNASILGGNDKRYFTLNFNTMAVAAVKKDTANDKKYGFLNLYVESGTLYSGVPVKNSSNWIDASVTHGIGSRNLAFVTINGGTVTSVSNSTAAAIGGGGGYRQIGGVGCVEINGGNVYAYNNGVVYKNNTPIPGTAIGSGSCAEANSATGVVKINGGNVYAQSIGGVAIGGGSSGQKDGGSGYVTITGGNITARSIPGTIAPKSSVKKDVSQGVSIGGGVGGATGGNAIITIKNSPVVVAGSVGGGNSSGSGANGYANVNISGGDIRAQFVMEGGSSTSCKFIMSGGTIHSVNVSEGQTSNVAGVFGKTYDIFYVYKDGGALWMKDKNGESTVTGGNIEYCTAQQGGAVYMTGGRFVIEGGNIGYNTSVGSSDMPGRGGAIHIDNSSGNNVRFEMSGGSITNNYAVDGGGIYLKNGIVNITGGAVSTNEAEVNGGGIFVEEGTITMYGGNVTSNIAGNCGGGFYVSANVNPVLVDILSGSITNNVASSNGGGVAIKSDSNVAVDVIVGINCDHGLDSDRNYTPFSYPADYGLGHVGHTNHLPEQIHSSCPVVSGNSAVGTGDSDGLGGGFYLSSTNAHLNFYCVIETDNHAGNSNANSMYMEGGVVQIVGDETYEDGQIAKGNIRIESSILVEGGQVDIYGEMTNPHFTDDVTVNIHDPENDHYIDHRIPPSNSINHYKVHYVENFSASPDEPATGLYIARQYPSVANENLTPETGLYDVTILSNVFVHPGYRIVGWCTSASPSSLNPDSNIPGETWYKINETYNLSTLTVEQGMGTDILLPGVQYFTDDNLLRIYAIWEKVEYFIDFERNAPVGVSSSGVMINQRVAVDDFTTRLTPNAYSVDGYRFIGWSLTPDGSDGSLYEDNALITENFTETNGDTVVLYAQWELCTHPSDQLVYSADGDTVTETCSYCGHEATARISASDAVYDGLNHPAIVIYSEEWIGEKNLVITYEMAADTNWDSRDSVDEEWNSSANPIPCHAGTYTAVISVSGDEATCTYVISPAKWETPDTPEVELVPHGSEEPDIRIVNPQGELILYSMVRSSGTPDYWTENNTFESLSYGEYYYFFAIKDADRDHLRSDCSMSEAYLYQGGNIVIFECDDGFNVIQNIDGTGFDFSVELLPDYHLENYNLSEPDVSLITSDAINRGITLNRSDEANFNYSIEGLQESYFCRVVIKVTGAVKNCSVVSQITHGEVFSDFNGSSVTTISSDSAFTARFEVSDYVHADYESQSLVFGSDLPSGTTIIMRENDDSYWYYNLESSSSVINIADFTSVTYSSDFIEMGGGTEFVPSSISNSSFVYQFIVDFSDVPNRDVNDVDLSVALVLTAKRSNVPTVTGSLVAELEHVAEFDISATPTNPIDGNSCNLSCIYTPSVGYASIWERRNTALVLTATSDVPSDLTLSVVNGYNTITYAMNRNNQFIVRLGDVDSNDSINLTLNSLLFDGSSIEFDAAWYVSESLSCSAPLSGLKTSETHLIFNPHGVVTPSLRIVGSGNDNRLFNVGDNINVDITYLNVTENSTIRVEIQTKRPNGTYSDTGSYEVFTVDSSELNTRSLRINLGDMAPGSYRIFVIVQNSSGANELTVPYYFVIK